MGRTSNAIRELAKSHEDDWATPSELVKLAEILVAQFEKNYSHLSEFDDRGIFDRISRQTEQLADLMDIAKEEAECIDQHRDYLKRRELFERGYDVSLAR